MGAEELSTVTLHHHHHMIAWVSGTAAGMAQVLVGHPFDTIKVLGQE